VVKHTEAKLDFVLLPRRWVVETKLRMGRTLPPPGQRLRTPLANLPAFPYLAFACLMLSRIFKMLN
jgi:hypothetical protein